MAVNVVSRGEECLPLFDRFIFGGGEQQDNLSAVAFQREEIQLLLSTAFDSLLFASNNGLHYEIESFLQRLNDKFSLYLNARMIWQKSPSFHTAWSHTMPDNIEKMERFSFQFIQIFQNSYRMLMPPHSLLTRKKYLKCNVYFDYNSKLPSVIVLFIFNKDQEKLVSFWDKNCW